MNPTSSEIFRSAFIVESVQIRIASKSQKKFAILMISDGMERLELPVWPDLYEEKSHLCQENQLLYAVLQAEKKEEALSLSCKWVDDLTKANEEMIEECDKAYDKAKHQTQRYSAAKNKGVADKPKTEKPQKENPPMKTLSIRLNANAARLSHIVKLKQAIEEHYGANPIEVHFYHEAQNLAVLQIDPKWTVSGDQAFIEKVKQIESVLEVAS
jgi:DNA polymerase-3 subunit alpha